VKLNVLESFAGSRKRKFLLGGAIGVVKRSLWGSALSDFSQVIDGKGFVKSTLLGIWLKALKAH
jgi:hypothetical protein